VRDRVVVISGGTGALGQAMVLAFLGAGARVCVPYVVPAEQAALQARLPPAEAARVEMKPCDLADEAAVNAYVSNVAARHRRVDVLVNAVGGFAGGDLASTPMAEWNRMMTLNLTTAVVGCRAVLPEMTRARWGRIVNIASRAVIPPQGGFIAYTVSKAAVITLTQALAQEVRAQGVTVNAVLPSTMDTPANRKAMPDADRSGWVSTESVAQVVAFLASDAAGAVTGAAVTV
jgi:NAD(P)-dependent dehydrogenase (short-subunit alcohol dehydrogenase family)